MNVQDAQFIEKNTQQVTRCVQFIVMLFLVEKTNGQVVFVDVSSNVNGNGVSWATPFNDLQKAIESASESQEIWVKKGFYKPTQSIGVDSAFRIMKAIKLFGGFAGVETSINERNIDVNPTTIEGDIGQILDTTDNTRCLFYLTGTGSVSEINGFVFQNAHASLPITSGNEKVGNSGAALFIDASSTAGVLNIKNCRFFKNSAIKNGGAIFYKGSIGSKISIFNCEFDGNNAVLNGGCAHIINGSVIVQNTLINGNGGHSGNCAGFLIVNDIQGQKFDIEFKNCKFTSNVASYRAALNIEVKNTKSKILIEDCSFEKNESGPATGSSSGIVAADTVKVRKCNFSSSRDGLNLSGRECNFFIDSCQFFNCQLGVDINNLAQKSTTLKLSKSQFINCIQAIKASLHNMSTLDISGNRFSGNKYRFISGDIGINFDFYNNIVESDSSLYGAMRIADLLNTVPVGRLNFFNNSFRFKYFESNCFWIKNQSFHFNNNVAQVDEYSSGSVFLIDDGFSFFSDNAFNQDSLSVFGQVNSLFSTFGEQVFDSSSFFQNTSTNDYRLPPCSPAINAGQNAAAIDLLTDYAGNPRIQDGQIDLGALESDQLAGSATANGPVCGTAKNGKISFALPNGCLPAALAWTNQNGQTGTDSTGLEKGIYAVTLTDGRGKKWSDTLEIAGSALVGYIDGDTLDCFGANQAQLTAVAENGLPPIEYQWSNGQNTAQIDGLGAGIFVVEMTDSVGCVAVDTAEILETEFLQASFALVKAAGPTAANGAASVDVFGGTGPFQIQWSTGDTTRLLTGLLPGFYQITITDAGGCSEVYEIEIDWTSPTNEAGDDFDKIKVRVNLGDSKIQVQSDWNAQAFFELVDAAGKRLLWIPIQKGMNEIDIQFYASGHYFYGIFDHQMIKKTGNLVIQR